MSQLYVGAEEKAGVCVNDEKIVTTSAMQNSKLQFIHITFSLVLQYCGDHLHE